MIRKHTVSDKKKSFMNEVNSVWQKGEKSDKEKYIGVLLEELYKVR